MNNNNNNFDIVNGFSFLIPMFLIDSSEKFALDLFEIIHEYLNKDKNKLFPCNCSCSNNKMYIWLLSEEKISKDIGLHLKDRSFEYSLEVGFFPFDLVKGFYLEFSKLNYIYVVVVVDEACGK